MFAVFLSRVVLRRTGLLREDVPELTDLQEVDNMLEESVDRWSDEILRRGILQGRQEGLAEGRQSMIVNMVHADFSVEQISIALGLPLEDTRELLAHIQ